MEFNKTEDTGQASYQVYTKRTVMI